MVAVAAGAGAVAVAVVVTVVAAVVATTGRRLVLQAGRACRHTFDWAGEGGGAEALAPLPACHGAALPAHGSLRAIPRRPP